MKFECYQIDNEAPDDAGEIEAYDEEDAAKEYAEKWDNHCGEGYAERQVIAVRRKGADNWKRFSVSAEAYVRYSAREEEPS